MPSKTSGFQLRDHAAQLYECCSVPMTTRPLAELMFAHVSLHAGERILDVACGTGIVARLAAARIGPAGQIVGIDLNPSMLDVATLVYATDYEPFALPPRSTPPGTRPVHPEDQRHLRFLEGADLVIHDAQYRLAEFPAKTGWGHMPIERAVDYALLADVPRLVLFHHDPGRDDDAVDHLLAGAQARARAGGGGVEVIAAAEGQVIELSDARTAGPTIGDSTPSVLHVATRCESLTVLLAMAEPEGAREYIAALHEEGLRVLWVETGEAALQLSRQEQPAVVLLARRLAGLNGLAVCQLLRAESASGLQEVPIVLLGEKQPSTAELMAAFAAGATDYVPAPFKAALLRSRVRAWLMRTAPD